MGVKAHWTRTVSTKQGYEKFGMTYKSSRDLLHISSIAVHILLCFQYSEVSCPPVRS